MPENLTYLDQLMEQGYAQKTLKIVNDKVEITIQSLSTSDQLELEHFMTTVQGAPAFVVHTYSIKLLSYILKRYRTQKVDKSFIDPKSAEEFVRSLASVLIDVLLTAHNEFNSELSKLITPENIDKNFSVTPPTA